MFSWRLLCLSVASCGAELSKERQVVFNITDDVFVKGSESFGGSLLSIKSVRSVSKELTSAIDIEVGNLGPVNSVASTLRIRSLDLGKLNQCRTGLSARSFENRYGLPRVAVEYADYEEYVKPVSYSWIASNAEQDIGESLTFLAVDYPCLEIDVLPKTVHRWRWVISDPGLANDELFTDPQIYKAYTIALRHTSFGFMDIDQGVAVVVSTTNDLTYVHNFTGKTAETQALRNVYYAPTTANSTSTVSDEDLEIPHIHLEEDYWMDMVVTTGNESSIRLDTWIRDRYYGYAVVDVAPLRIADLDMTPLTIPLTTMFQDTDSTVLFLEYESIHNDTLTDSLIKTPPTESSWPFAT